jgi:CRP-like cAMP-binding protein
MIATTSMDAERASGRRPTPDEVLQRLSGGLAGGDSARSIRIVPFVRGRRPTDEAKRTGLGSSDRAALVLGRRPAENRAYVLFSIPDGNEGKTVDATLAFTGPDGRVEPGTISGWHRRPLKLRCFDERGDGSLRPARRGDRQFVLAVAPDRDLWPGATWEWGELGPEVRDAAAGDEDPYGFGHLFLQRLAVELRLLDGATCLSTAATTLDVCDVRRLGSLYGRLLERLVEPDTERQAAAAGVANPGRAYHPWFPVLLIGSDKAALYTRALVADIVDKQRYLTDPAWLLRVGIYLELLTCLGIAEAVRDEAGDLLTPMERAAFESERFAAIRERLDVAAWRDVWALREISFPRRSIPRAGPVSISNLLAKKRATLRFLHVHHEDLKRAIELAGANPYSAQETWCRVFRDAERAVMRQTPAAFPELGYLPAPARELVLWHRRGRPDARRWLRAPNAVSALMHDQDGLFPAACNQYRMSMNAVAAWARERSLMNPAGRECVPRRVSLLEAYMNTPERVAALQRRDGYGEQLDVSEASAAAEPPLEDAEALLASVPIFRLLDPQELRALARGARPLALGPAERFVVQGTEGTSLFVVADGTVEVVLRRPHGPDMHVDTMGRGAVVGEMSLLTGEPRSATVRAADAALVYEIGWRQYEPLLRAHPEWIDELAAIMEQRLRERRASLAAYELRERQEIGRRILQRFFGGIPHPAVRAAAPAE